MLVDVLLLTGSTIPVLEKRPKSIVFTQSIFNSEHTKEKFHNGLLIHCSVLELQELGGEKPENVNSIGNNENEEYQINEIFEEQHQFLLTSQSDSYNERYENIEQKKKTSALADR